MCKILKIALKFGTAKSQFGQGECLAPFIFSMLMMAFGLLRDQAHNDRNTSKMCFSRNRNSHRDRGKLISHKTKSKGINLNSHCYCMLTMLH